MPNAPGVQRALVGGLQLHRSGAKSGCALGDCGSCDFTRYLAQQGGHHQSSCYSVQLWLVATMLRYALSAWHVDAFSLCSLGRRRLLSSNWARR